MTVRYSRAALSIQSHRCSAKLLRTRISIARRVVELAQDDVGAGEAGLGAVAGAEDAGMQVERHALGSRSRARGPRDEDGGAGFADVGHGGVLAGQRGAQSLGEIRASPPSGPTISHSFGPSQRQARSPAAVKRLACDRQVAGR